MRQGSIGTKPLIFQIIISDQQLDNTLDFKWPQLRNIDETTFKESFARNSYKKTLMTFERLPIINDIVTSQLSSTMDLNETDEETQIKVRIFLISYIPKSFKVSL